MLRSGDNLFSRKKNLSSNSCYASFHQMIFVHTFFKVMSDLKNGVFPSEFEAEMPLQVCCYQNSRINLSHVVTSCYTFLFIGLK